MDGCAGGGAGLFATVPPPVEFTAGVLGDQVSPARVFEYPAAGRYLGNVSVQRVTMRRNDEGRWFVTSAADLGLNRRAIADIGTDHSIVLRWAGEEKPLFNGTLKVDEANERADAKVTSFDGATGIYPYSLVPGSPESFLVSPHAGVHAEGDAYVYDRYKFELSP